MGLAGAMGDDVTTTGGPDQSFADPASGSTSADDPVVIDRETGPLDGDDIVVEPGPTPSSHPRRRARELLVGGVVVVLVGAGIAVALASRDNGGSSKLQSSAPVAPPAAHPTVPKPAVVKPALPKPAPKPANVKPLPVVVPPVANSTPTAVSTPVAASPPPTAVTMPPVEPPSVLQWQSTPPSLSMNAGTAKSFTVSVTNPTNGTVNLPHPLSCAPALLRANGTAVGFGVCTEMVQVMQPHQTLARHYTIYATETADASGAPLAAGSYTARVENLYSVNVTVTAK
jgi:hypothetical protein